MTKHGKVIRYVSQLPIGTKISVRTIANLLDISEGTAYKGIKECSKMGIVTTIPRIGTIRIRKPDYNGEENITYGEIVNIVDGNIAAGKKSIHKTINKMIIGAMTLERIKEYITPNSLIIVGNRERVQELALLNGCGIIITGGFECSNYIKELADTRGMPVICSLYDTFTVAKMINRAIFHNKVKKKILLVKDIMNKEFFYFRNDIQIGECADMIRENSNKFKGVSVIPVVNENMRFLGLVKLQNILEENPLESIETIMKKNVTTLEGKTSVAYANYIIETEANDFYPVIRGKELIGTVKRQDIIQALKYISKENKDYRNLDSEILKNFKSEMKQKSMHFCGTITPEMLDPLGIASWNSLNMLISSMATFYLKQMDVTNLFVDNISTYFMKPVQIDTEIEANTTIMSSSTAFCEFLGKAFYKVEVNLFDDKKDLIAKSLITIKAIENKL
ncbi:DRTGG domain-containing protein [Clostridium cochlearium]|uniref:DRTGG domain-containing protein n=1 Tax=Clostridium cochlearium TaxID=1494 RepID=UPI003F65DB78